MNRQTSRLTKIIATIGPSCESEEMIAEMIKAGVNVFRFNFKHNTVDWHNQMIDRVDKVAKSLKVRIGTLIDLQGPEIRVVMNEEDIEINVGDKLLLGEEALTSAKTGFSITHPEVISHLESGQKIVLDDGAFEFVVLKKAGQVLLESKSSGILKPRKTMNIPGADFPFPVLIDRDLEGIRLAKRRQVDFVALSFVRSAQDVQTLRQEMRKLGVKSQIVSKIETQKSINDIDAIIEASDGIMVARGDLGVELPLEQVPYYQKLIINKCIENGKFAITATQMLQTMITSPLATRAEISDIANATYDLTDAVMLSGESASGAYPLESVEIMRKTIEFNEAKFNQTQRKGLLNYSIQDSTAMITKAAYELFVTSQRKESLDIKAFMIFTHTGSTARAVSAYRPNMPIYAFCPDIQTAKGLTLDYGVTPLIRGSKYKKHMSVTHNHVLAGLEYLRTSGYVEKGDSLIVIHGDFWDIEGGSSTVKLVKVFADKT